ncbi:MAG: YihY family inner membrane protein [Gammaproteobacteria bacterium]|nr:YihY family inner membrane protein [Gammaproteobacteria bacterium]
MNSGADRGGDAWRLGSALWPFAAYLYRRFRDDRCLMTATALSYTTLLSLVPLLVVVFSIVSAFPVFEAATATMQDFIFRNFLPAAGETVQQYVTGFMDKAGTLTGVGIVFLVITALMLMNTIDAALNGIWRVRKARAMVAKLAVYWAALTLGPLLIAVSVLATTYVVGMSRFGEAAGAALVSWTPFLSTTLALTLLYVLVPNRRIPFRYGVISAVLAAALFEVAKVGFAHYVASGPVYGTIYGALATVPLFLVWVYVSWAIVLLGVEFNYCLAMFRPPRPYRFPPLVLACRVLGHLWHAQLRGETVGEAVLARMEPAADPAMLDDVLQELERRRLIHSVEPGIWGLARDLDELSLLDLYRLFPGALTDAKPDADWGTADEWNRRLLDLLMQARGSVWTTLQVPLKTVYREEKKE